MLGYFTFVALLNLGLGYALAIFLHGGERRSLRQFVSDLRSFRSKSGIQQRENAESDVSTTTLEPAQEELKSTDSDLQPEVVEKSRTSAAIPEMPIRTGEPSTGLVTLDYVDQLLAAATAASESSGTPTSVVLLELDGIDGANDVANDRLLCGLAETVRGLLDDAHTAARFADQRFFLLLPGEDESQATQRAEHVRQQIEATEFFADGSSVHATVTCALAQVSTDSTPSQLMEALQGALARAKRLGGNRTYMFDGIAPSPVVPPELNLAPQKCAI